MKENQGWILVFPNGEISPVYSMRGMAEYAAQQHDPQPEIVEVDPTKDTGETF